MISRHEQKRVFSVTIPEISRDFRLLHCSAAMEARPGWLWVCNVRTHALTKVLRPLFLAKHGLRHKHGIKYSSLRVRLFQTHPQR